MVFEKKSTVNYGRVFNAFYGHSVFNGTIKVEVKTPPVAVFSLTFFLFFSKESSELESLEIDQSRRDFGKSITNHPDSALCANFFGQSF